MPRPQFTLRALLVLLLAVACFFGGIRFERERQRRADIAAELAAVTNFDNFVGIATIDPSYHARVRRLLEGNGIKTIIEGSVVYGVSVPPQHQKVALSLLRNDAAARGYWIQTE